MKFKVIGTKVTLAPNDLAVVKSYLAQPDIYEPADKDAKDAAAALKKTTAGDDGDGTAGGQE